MKSNRRSQTPKSAATRTSSNVRLEMSLRNGDGFHRAHNTYQRAPKHRGQGWDN